MLSVVGWLKQAHQDIRAGRGKVHPSRPN
ncbi:hypothetical protein CO2235_50056 [Cupriavidus oxalaticus]|uniref:Uncharacterized protein n=1 Tax=Cupriavidus oxalaticus TaxID=96344 RepID=A0A976GAT5_9BURK|nr:hypothetical protein CO2235_50056 [Cupriavidus oxalaticus]